MPLLGAILSGGEGEGVFAITFTLSGDADDPDIFVNPLSLLTPGFLRNVFEGAPGKKSEDFRNQLQQPDQ